MPELETRTVKHLEVPFQIKAVSEKGRVEGYASVYGVVDSDGDIVASGAFAESIREREGRPLPMLWQHDSREPIGVFDEMREDEYGLKVAGNMLVDEVSRAREARALAKAGALGGMSIGFMIRDCMPREDGRGLLITRGDLWETSLVTFPANQAARITGIKEAFARGRTPTKREMEALLTRDAGMSRSQARALMRGGFDALANATQDAGEDDEAQEIVAALKAALANH
jgi:hypothetical protein